MLEDLLFLGQVYKISEVELVVPLLFPELSGNVTRDITYIKLNLSPCEVRILYIQKTTERNALQPYSIMYIGISIKIW
jgi:hypothetical protein